MLLTNTHAAPMLLSLCAPIANVFPSELNATEVPCSEIPTYPVPTSLGPCCVHGDPTVRVNTHVAPIWPLSASPPTANVVPSEFNAIMPCDVIPTPPVPINFFPNWVYSVAHVWVNGDVHTCPKFWSGITGEATQAESKLLTDANEP
jgi:hypothetical protein